MPQRKPSNAWALYTFLSSRLNQGRGFGSFVKGTAVLGILVGATALWITLSVVRGFSTVISEKTVEFAPELTISLASGETFTRSDTLLQRIRTVAGDQWSDSGRQTTHLTDSMSSLSVILDEQVMIQHQGQVTGGLLRGVEREQFDPLLPFVQDERCGEVAWNKASGNEARGNKAKGNEARGNDAERIERVEQIKQTVQQRSATTTQQRPLPVWLGQGLAQELGIITGQTGRLLRLDMASVGQDLPTIGVFRLCGVLSTGIAPLDDGLIMAPLDATQAFVGASDLTGTGLALNIERASPEDLSSLQDAILGALPYTFVVESVYQRWRSLFAWIELQEQTIPLVITFLVLIAAFNLVGAVMMMVLERTQAIAVLRVLGMPQAQLRVYFITEGLRVALLGLAGAAVLTAVIHGIQWSTGIITLPVESYYMETMPLVPTVLDGVIVIVSTLGLSMLASWIPATIASKVDPTATLRFQQ
ncbi:MAG: FtsX-like permease family protein [Balneolaceae bacterium]|nr:FtsX-like permease family protein [Balneolaceae bacterium]